MGGHLSVSVISFVCLLAFTSHSFWPSSLGAWDLGSSGLSSGSDAASRKSAGGSVAPPQGTPAVKPGAAASTAAAAASASLAAPAKSVRISQAGSAPTAASAAAAGKASEGASNAPQPILKKKEPGPVAVACPLFMAYSWPLFLLVSCLCHSVSVSLLSLRLHLPYSCT
jgi:hypothetical protein